MYNEKQLARMKNDKGFVAALDQSGGSTPKALKLYGINEDRYKNEDEMFDLVHAMRTRIIKSKAFDSSKILGAILFEQTMDRKIDGMYTGDFLWEKKGIVPFLKVDKGLAEEKDGVQLMKDFPELEALLKRAVDRHIFGTKMRSVIKKADSKGIKAVVDQQFDWAKRIASFDLVPIVEPEVDINSPEKAECEALLKSEIESHMKDWPNDKYIMFKTSIPTEPDLYRSLMSDPRIVRIVALSGGYTTEKANELLSLNHGLIASFSRALAEGLSDSMSDDEFNSHFEKTIDSIYEASIK